MILVCYVSKLLVGITFAKKVEACAGFFSSQTLTFFVICMIHVSCSDCTFLILVGLVQFPGLQKISVQSRKTVAVLPKLQKFVQIFSYRVVIVQKYENTALIEFGRCRRFFCWAYPFLVDFNAIINFVGDKNFLYCITPISFNNYYQDRTNQSYLVRCNRDLIAIVIVKFQIMIPRQSENGLNRTKKASHSPILIVNCVSEYLFLIIKPNSQKQTTSPRAPL
eukprot:TRINITY_DN28604_c0_g1_i1.p1 TRINITY_DN28604_c0_g1~~TRINITY_DN28604_c0_g1_i1.p1  ORF type:complete len:222 (-),score=-6.46 TRINITY_DN28604_c0_g1_i1:32-697(-)